MTTIADTFQTRTHPVNIDSALRPNSGIPSLVVIDGLDIGRRYVLSEPDVCLGRDPELVYSVEDDSVSRIHCHIVHSDSTAYIIEDLHSKNGTFVNLDPINRAQLESGDKIMIGKTILKFELTDNWDHRFQIRLEQLLNIDDLTGLLSKRHFDLEFEQAFKRCRRTGERLSLLMMDLDGLKKVNDTYGHLAGAHTITKVGMLIGRRIKNEGIAARFGGDEFMVLLPGLGLHAAAKVAEEMTSEIRNLPIRLTEIDDSYPTVELSVGVSTGVAEWCESIRDSRRMLDHADKALYQAKRFGGNRVELY